MAGFIAVPIAEIVGSLGASSGIAAGVGTAAEGYVYSQAEKSAKELALQGIEQGWDAVYGSGEYKKLPEELKQGQDQMWREVKDALNIFFTDKQIDYGVNTITDDFNQVISIFGYGKGDKPRYSDQQIQKQNRINQIALANMQKNNPTPNNSGRINFTPTSDQYQNNQKTIGGLQVNQKQLGKYIGDIITNSTKNNDPLINGRNPLDLSMPMNPSDFIKPLEDDPSLIPTAKTISGLITDAGLNSGLSDRDPEYPEIYDTYNGKNLSPASIFLNADGNFAGIDEVGNVQIYTGSRAPNNASFVEATRLGFTKGYDTWVGPNSYNNALPTTLLGTFAFFHDQDYENGYFDKKGDLKFISRIEQNIDRMTFQERIIANFTLKWFKNYSYMLGKFVGNNSNKSSPLNGYSQDTPISTETNLVRARDGMVIIPYQDINPEDNQLIIPPRSELTKPGKYPLVDRTTYNQIMMSYSMGLQQAEAQVQAINQVLNSIIITDFYD